MDNRSIFLEQRKSILRYLAEHPHAADTLEGVVVWWLSRQRFNDTRAAIEQVLEELVVEGLVTKKYSLDNTVIYGSSTPESGGMH